jgi:hypothetical protein
MPPEAPSVEGMSRADALEHDPEKWIPVFGKDHAPPGTQSVMTSEAEVITL